MSRFMSFVKGVCTRNPSHGGIGVCTYAPNCKLFNKVVIPHVGKTTRNAMDVQAAIAALRTVPVGELLIISDSQYLYSGIKLWLDVWKGNDWKNSKGQAIANKNLWIELDDLIGTHSGTIEWRLQNSNEDRRWIDFAGRLAWQAQQEAHVLAKYLYCK